MKFEFLIGDITDVTADAVVLPANKNLKEGSGASRAIFEKAGRKKLQSACDKIGHCDVGLAVPTPAYDLNADYVIHACVPKWIDGKSNEYELLSSAYYSALKIADLMNCKTIAFPLLSSGNNGFDISLAYKIATESISAFESTNLTNVCIVVYDENTINYVQSQVGKLLFLPKLIKPKIKVAKDVAEKAIKKAIVFFKEPKNAKKALDIGIEIFKFIKVPEKETLKLLINIKNILNK